MWILEKDVEVSVNLSQPFQALPLNSCHEEEPMNYIFFLI
jgi:hypothetical protein